MLGFWRGFRLSKWTSGKGRCNIQLTQREVGKVRKLQASRVHTATTHHRHLQAATMPPAHRTSKLRIRSFAVLTKACPKLDLGVSAGSCRHGFPKGDLLLNLGFQVLSGSQNWAEEAEESGFRPQNDRMPLPLAPKTKDFTSCRPSPLHFLGGPTRHVWVYTDYRPYEAESLKSDLRPEAPAMDAAPGKQKQLAVASRQIWCLTPTLRPTLQGPPSRLPRAWQS